VAARERPCQTWKLEDEGNIFISLDLYLLLNDVPQVSVLSTRRTPSNLWHTSLMDACSGYDASTITNFKWPNGTTTDVTQLSDCRCFFLL
jgi:hypothetical protein